MDRLLVVVVSSNRGRKAIAACGLAGAVLLGAVLTGRILSLPTSITVSPTNPTLVDIDTSQQFTAQSGDTGDAFPLPGVTAIQVDAGQGACAVLSDGTLHCWPNELYFPAVGPLPVIGLSQVTAVSDGGGGIGHTCALFADTTVKCWGNNFFGALGDGSTTRRDTPVTVVDSTGAPLTNVTAISAGKHYTCALLGDTTVKCWGDNGASGQGGPGQLGDGTVGGYSTSPVTVSGLTGATAISAGDGHTCALLSDMTAKCWGGNSGGELGDPTSVGQWRATPVPVAGLTGATAISAEGIGFTCASLVNGTVKCWGRNNGGRLGTGNTTDSSVPVLVSGLSTARTVALGPDHACALLSDTTVKCWGGNEYGQLGNGTTLNSLVPVPVSGLSTARHVSPGSAHTCALLDNATVKCWGLNNSGQLGTGFTVPLQNSTPVATSPLGRVAWTSSDPGVANMDAFWGVAYGVARGTTTITATYGPLSASTTLTIGNDPPSLSITDVSVNEGNSGTSNAVFTVRLSAASSQTVTVDFATADDTATTADDDYVAQSGTLTFLPDETSKTITVQLKGDTKIEPDETLLINLSNAANATLSDAQAVGGITNDDAVQITVNEMIVVSDSPGVLPSAMIAVAENIVVTDAPVATASGANNAPTANAGGNRTVEADSPLGANVLLLGSGSDPDSGDTLSYLWTGPFGSASGAATTQHLPFGANTVSLTVTDNHGASATDTVVITVTDTTPPVITLNAPASGAIYRIGQTVAASYSCADVSSGVTSCAGTVAAGAAINTSTVGTKTFVVTATDAAGNAAQRQSTYSVQYSFVGFFAPLDNPPSVNDAQAGATVAVRWELQGSGGTLISDPSSIVSLASAPLDCAASPDDVAEQAFSSAGGVAPRFDGTQWIFNWRTTRGWTGCRALRLTLADGTRHFAVFRF